MKKYLITTLLLAVVILIKPISAVNAAVDYFNTLESLVIGQPVSESTLRQGAQILHDGAGTKYSFESSWYSTPHILIIDNDVLDYLELKVPQEQIEKYKTLKNSLGEPEVDVAKAQSLRFISFPSQGIGFIVSDYSENDIRLVKFPAKTEEAFIQEEGRNFEFVPQNIDPPIEKTNDNILSPRYQENLGTPDGQETSQSWWQNIFGYPIWFWGLIALFFFSLIGLGFIVNRFLKERKAENLDE